jgi:hypothetical protein
MFGAVQSENALLATAAMHTMLVNGAAMRFQSPKGGSEY